MLAIRFATPDDAEAVAAIYAPIVRETAISFETEPPDADEMRARMEKLRGRWPWLIAADGERVAGYAYASEHRGRPAYRWNVDVSVYVAEDARGKGIGRRLYDRLLTILERQGYYTAFAGIALPNGGSVALHESVGFTLVAVYPAVGFKHGRWHDVSWWRRPLRTPAGPPAELLPLDAPAID